jgi:hypothetical protein
MPSTRLTLAPRALRYHRAMVTAIRPHDGPDLLRPQERGAAGARQPSTAEPRRLRPHEIPHPTLAADTDPAAERVQLSIYREMTPSRKLQHVFEAIDVSRDLALAGLGARHPAAGPGDLRRRLYSLELGEELAAKVYGPLRQDSGEP